jgi:hypothetical protein
MSNNWIRVEDRLPETGEDVLVYTLMGLVGTGWRSSRGHWIGHAPDAGYGEVTHWQPMPELPVQKENA